MTELETLSARLEEAVKKHLEKTQVSESSLGYRCLHLLPEWEILIQFNTQRLAHSVSRFLYAVFAQLAVLPAHNRIVAGSIPASGTTPAARPAKQPDCQAWQPKQGQKGHTHGTQKSRYPQDSGKRRNLQR